MRAHVKHAVRLLLGLYVAGCVAFSTLMLAGYGSILALVWAVDPNKGAEAASHDLILQAFRNTPKQLAISAAMNSGDWTLSCLQGPRTSGLNVIEIARSKGIRLDDKENGQFGFQKRLTTFLYIEKSGKARRFYPEYLSGMVASGETVCITPENPTFNLPTPAQAALIGQLRK